MASESFPSPNIIAYSITFWTSPKILWTLHLVRFYLHREPLIECFSTSRTFMIFSRNSISENYPAKPSFFPYHMTLCTFVWCMRNYRVALHHAPAVLGLSCVLFAKYNIFICLSIVLIFHHGTYTLSFRILPCILLRIIMFCWVIECCTLYRLCRQISSRSS